MRSFIQAIRTEGYIKIYLGAKPLRADNCCPGNDPVTHRKVSFLESWARDQQNTRSNAIVYGMNIQ